MEKELVKVEHQEVMQSFGNKADFELTIRMAQVLSASTIVPPAYQGEKGLPNCIIALDMARRMNLSPLMVIQNLYVVKGMPSFSSKFLIARLNQCGRFSMLKFEEENPNTDQWRCRAYAIEKSTGETLYGSWVTMQMVKSEGWLNKEGSKWKTMPEHMFKYRSASFFVDEFAPELKQGISTKEEIEDITPIEVIPNESKPTMENANAIVINTEDTQEEKAEAEKEQEPKEAEQAEPTPQPQEEAKPKAVKQEVPDLFK